MAKRKRVGARILMADERHPDDPDKCCYCGTDLRNIGRVVGAGDGSGNRFSCGPCFDMREIAYLRKMLRLHGEALQKLAHEPVVDRTKLCEEATSLRRLGGGQ